MHKSCNIAMHIMPCKQRTLPHQQGRAQPLRSITGPAAETETVAAQLTLAKSASGGASKLSATSSVDISGATNTGFGWIIVSFRSHIQSQCGMNLTMYDIGSVASGCDIHARALFLRNYYPHMAFAIAAPCPMFQCHVRTNQSPSPLVCLGMQSTLVTPSSDAVMKDICTKYKC